MRSVVASFLAVILLISLAAGCAPADTSSSAAPADSTAASSVAPAASSAAPAASTDASGTADPAGSGEFTYPMTDAPEFTYWLQLYANISPFANNFAETELAKNWQAATGTKLTFEHPAAPDNASMLESLNLIFASGDYPDMIHFDWTLYPGGVARLYNEGISHDLTDAIANYMPNLTSVLTDPQYADAQFEKLAKEDDGKIYKVPMLMSGQYLALTSGPVVRSDLLEKYSLPIPETVGEWDAALEAVKGDVETPFVMIYGDLDNMWTRAWGIRREHYETDGVVKYGAVQPEYLAFLTQLNDWYARGLFDQNFTTTQRADQDAMMSGGTGFATWGSGGQHMGQYAPILQENGMNIAGAPHPVLEKGGKAVLNTLWQIKNTGGVVVTKNVSDENLEYACRFLDYFYSPEGQILSNFGVEGTTFEYVDGEPTYTDFILTPPDGKTLAQQLSNWTFANSNGPIVQLEPYIFQYYSLPEQQDALRTWHSNLDTNSRTLDRLTPTPEEASEFAQIFNPIRSYTDECTQLFINGTKPLAEFDAFVAELEAMNLARTIELRQAAYDRFMAR